MPFTFDFGTSVSDTVLVKGLCPKGWVSPINIEYCVAQAHKYDTELSVIWRVQGTTHCFTIPERRLNVLSHGEYEPHFTTVLENFREDYLSWFRDEEYKDAQWKYEYQRQYGGLILPHDPSDDDDNKGKNQ